MRRFKLGLPFLLVGVLCLGACIYCCLRGENQMGVGLIVGYIIALGYLLGLKRVVRQAGGGAAGRLKLLMSVRMLSLAVIFLLLGVFLPRSLWGLLIAFTGVFLAFMVDLA